MIVRWRGSLCFALPTVQQKIEQGNQLTSSTMTLAIKIMAAMGTEPISISNTTPPRMVLSVGIAKLVGNHDRAIYWPEYTEWWP